MIIEYAIFYGLPVFCLFGWFCTRRSPSRPLRSAYTFLVLMYGGTALAGTFAAMLFAKTPNIEMMAQAGLLGSVLTTCGIYVLFHRN